MVIVIRIAAHFATMLLTVVRGLAQRVPLRTAFSSEAHDRPISVRGLAQKRMFTAEELSTRGFKKG